MVEEQESLANIVRILNLYVDQGNLKTNGELDFIRNASSFAKVFLGERKQMYNWKFLGVEIRSEANAGD